MQNIQALKIIEKIQKDLFVGKFEIETMVTNLKKIREITMELNNPVLTKALRLAYEHLEQNNAFLINIPTDEPVENENVEEVEKFADSNNIDSLSYFLSLLADCSKKINLWDIKEYNKLFKEF